MIRPVAGLLVSIPAREFGAFVPSGSLFTLDELDCASVSDELRCALGLAVQVCAGQRSRVTLIARPEIFTHGVTLQWLRRRLDGIRDHWCLSDGHAVRPIPQLRNHLFLYRPSALQGSVAFKRLYRCASELLSTVHSQINTCYAFPAPGGRVNPPSVLLQADAAITTPPRYFAYRHHDSLELSVERTLASEGISESFSVRSPQVIHVLMTETALADPLFARKITAVIHESRAQSGWCVVVGIPQMTPGESITTRLNAVVDWARRSGLAPRRTSTAVVFSSEDPPPPAPGASATSELIVPTSWEFWRHPADYYARFHQVRIAGSYIPGCDRAALGHMLKTAFGRNRDAACA